MNNNKYQYKLKDKKISVWSFTETKVKGVTKRSYTKEYNNIWAYYRHSGGRAYLDGVNNVYSYDENAIALFIINNRPINADWLITYGGKIYRVTKIDDFEGYRDDIKIYCAMAENQNPEAYDGLET